MRCHCHLGVRPQRAVLRQRLGHEDVECCAVKLARIEGRENVIRHLLAAAAGVDDEGRPEGALA